MDASGLTTLQSLRVQNTQTPTLTIANTQSITELLGGTNMLSSADVTSILVALDGNGLLNGFVDLSGQSPSAPPTAAGQTAAANLTGKGWTVTVDAPPVFSGPVWAPATEVVTWTDTNGTFVGDLATYEAAVDVATLSDLTFGATGNLTSLTGLNTAPNLTSLDCNTNALTTLDCTNCTALTTLSCPYNSLTTLNVTGCTALTTLSCHYNSLTALDVSTCAALTLLYCYNNTLTELHILGCTALAQLFAYNNQFQAGAGGYVNILLADSVTNGVAVGLINISLQALSQPPDAGPPDGATAKTTLQGMGWFVFTD